MASQSYEVKQLSVPLQVFLWNYRRVLQVTMQMRGYEATQHRPRGIRSSRLYSDPTATPIAEHSTNGSMIAIDSALKVDLQVGLARLLLLL